MGGTATKPENKIVSAPTNINKPSGEVNMKEEHNNYPSFISFNGDAYSNGSAFNLWTIVLVIGATLIMVFIVKKILDCRRKSKAKKEAAKDAEKARDSRLEAIAMTPIKWNNDRFEEITEKITEKIDQVQKIVEVPNAGIKALPEPAVATPKIIMASPIAMPFNDPIAQMPAVTFADRMGPYAQTPGLTFGDMPYPFANNGYARRNRGRRN